MGIMNFKITCNTISQNRPCFHLTITFYSKRMRMKYRPYITPPGRPVRIVTTCLGTEQWQNLKLRLLHNSLSPFFSLNGLLWQMRLWFAVYVNDIGARWQGCSGYGKKQSALHSSRCSIYLGKQGKPTKGFRQNGYHRSRDMTVGGLHVRWSDVNGWLPSG